MVVYYEYGSVGEPRSLVRLTPWSTRTRYLPSMRECVNERISIILLTVIYLRGYKGTQKKGGFLFLLPFSSFRWEKVIACYRGREKERETEREKRIRCKGGRGNREISG